MNPEVSRELAEIVNELNRLLPGTIIGSRLVMRIGEKADEKTVVLMREVLRAIKALVES